MKETTIVFRCWVILAWLCVAAAVVDASTVDHRYQPGEHVEVWVNKIRAFVDSSTRAHTLITAHRNTDTLLFVALTLGRSLRQPPRILCLLLFAVLCP